ncbi:metal-dependent hydrolase [Cellulosilyticum sp. I15G10I2]|uniref:metal-dependent hydrolase n=1 Tax=Cellulosilyticum sp. I15G10I2 TaxID=1892843 RepID=UPI00085CB967|nr:metal-dependent hydrolase [Cellulosilyticum sp. I15G10I2]
MDYRTHIIGGIALAYGAHQLIQIDPQQVVIFYGCCTLGSILPDIDHPEAFISKFIPLLPYALYNSVGHRTLTHGILFTAIIFLLVAFINIVAGVGIALGILSHIALDMLSPYGVAFLYPFNKERIKIIRH